MPDQYDDAAESILSEHRQGGHIIGAERRLQDAIAAALRTASRADPAPPAGMVQQHEKQLADWLGAHPVFGLPVQSSAPPAAELVEVDMVRRRFVIVNEPGRIPDKKGPFPDEDYLIGFLREGIPLWPAGSRVTVVRLVDGDDIWLDDGREYLTVHEVLGGGRRGEVR